MVPRRVPLSLGLILLHVATGAALAHSQDPPPPASDPRPDEVLKKYDLKRSGTFWVLPEETSILRDFRDARSIFREVGEGMSNQREMELGAQARKGMIQQLRIHHDELSRQIAQLDEQLRALVVPPGGNNFIALQRNQVAEQRNSLVDVRNRVINELNFRQEQAKTQDQDQRLQLNAEVAERREKYMQYVLDLRKSVDAITAKYAKIGKDPEVTAALTALSTASKSKHHLGPSKALSDAIKQLQKSEGSVKSETIKLQRDNGVFHVTAMLNGKVPAQMVFDTGAGVTTISAKLAARLGLKPDPADQKITLKTADGTEVESRLTRLKSVRVGKFTVNDVECAVMPEGKGDVDSLLGQSFFKQFKVEFSHEAGTLALKRLETAGSTSEAPTGSRAASGDASRPSAKASVGSRRPTRQSAASSKRNTRARRPQASLAPGDEPPIDDGDPN